MVDRPTDFEDGFYSIENPLVFHFGHVYSPHNNTLYNELVTCLAEEVNTRSEVDNYGENINLDCLHLRCISALLVVSPYEDACVGCHSFNFPFLLQ